MNKYYLIGIGGIGMSALAHILKERNEIVLGSDKKNNTNVKRLKKKGVKVYLEHNSKNLDNEMKVVYSSGIDKEKNEEYLFAKDNKNTLWHRSDLLKYLMSEKKPILVAGTHGKTTTSSLLSYVLLCAKKDPSFAIGGIIKNEKNNARWGKGEYFVAEADESDGSFQKYNSYGAIITNIEEEHMSYWENKNNLLNAYYTFYKNVRSKELLFWCKDDKYLNEELPIEGVSYGFSKDADLRITSNKDSFSINFLNKKYDSIECDNLVGKHNVLNAAAVFGLCIKLGIEEEIIRYAFKTFLGVNRRLFNF